MNRLFPIRKSAKCCKGQVRRLRMGMEVTPELERQIRWKRRKGEFYQSRFNGKWKDRNYKKKKKPAKTIFQGSYCTEEKNK